MLKDCWKGSAKRERVKISKKERGEKKTEYKVSDNLCALGGPPLPVPGGEEAGGWQSKKYAASSCRSSCPIAFIFSASKGADNVNC